MTAIHRIWTSRYKIPSIHWFQNHIFRSHRPVLEFIEEHYIESLLDHTNDMTSTLDAYLKDKDVELLEVNFRSGRISVQWVLISISVESGNDWKSERVETSETFKSTIPKQKYSYGKTDWKYAGINISQFLGETQTRIWLGLISKG